MVLFSISVWAAPASASRETLLLSSLAELQPEPKNGILTSSLRATLTDESKPAGSSSGQASVKVRIDVLSSVQTLSNLHAATPRPGFPEMIEPVMTTVELWPNANGWNALTVTLRRFTPLARSPTIPGGFVATLLEDTARLATVTFETSVISMPV